MISLIEIFRILRKGNTPTEIDWKSIFSSVWHKTEKFPIEQILGLKEEIAKATTNFKGYHTSLGELSIAYPQIDNKKDFFAWVGSPYPGTVHKVFADKGAWTDTGEVPTQEEIDLSEYAKKIDVNKKADFENDKKEQVVYAKEGKIDLEKYAPKTDDKGGSVIYSTPRSSKYPYTNTSNGARIPVLLKAIVDFQVSPSVHELTKEGYTIHIASVQRSSTISAIKLYAKGKKTFLLDEVRFDNDPANGQIQKLISSKKMFRISVLWDELPKESLYTEMFNGYSLDDACFSFEDFITYFLKTIYDSIVYPPTTIVGFVDKRTGAINPAIAFRSTDYIPVNAGDVLTIIAAIYGNASICGYTNKGGDFVELSNVTSTSANDVVYSHEISIPDNINYIRVSTVQESIAQVIIAHSNKYIASGGNGGSMDLDNLALTGSALNIDASAILAEKMLTRFLGLKPNEYVTPTDGGYMHVIDNQLCFTLNGVTKKVVLQ